MSNAKSFRSMESVPAPSPSMAMESVPAPSPSMAMESVAAQPPSPESRGEWVRLATRIADPVLGALAAGRLRASMPVELAATATVERNNYAHLEESGNPKMVTYR